MSSRNPYHLCEEIFIEPFDENFIIYIPTRKIAMFADRHLADAFINLRDRLFSIDDDPNALMSELLDILKLNHDVQQGTLEHITKFRGAPKPTSVTLFLTTTCNLRCSYCCVSAGDRVSKSMEPETAYRGIDFIIKNAREQQTGSIYVGFVAAGEPTVNWTTLTCAYEYASKQAKYNDLTLVTSLKTNGVMSSSKTQWVVDRIDEIQISFDGLPAGSGADRISISGIDSTSHVEKTLRFFDSKDKAYKIRVTVPKHRISTMAESIAYICERFRPKMIQVEPAYQMGRYESSPNSETTEFLQQLRESIKISKGFGMPIIFGGTNIDSLNNHFCGISTDEFSLSAAGNVTACSTASTEDDPLAQEFFYGRYDGHGYSFDMDTLDALRARSVEEREYCRGCFAKWHCGGECHYKLLSLSSVENFTGTERCRIVREIIKDKLADRIESTGGQVWIGR